MFEIDWRKRVVAATPLISLFAYLVVGYMTDIWDKTLLIFLLIPIMPTLLGMKTIKITFTLIIAVIYIVLGVVFNLWHPGWIIFLLIPIYHIIFGRSVLELGFKKFGRNRKTYDAEFEDTEK